MRLIVVTLALLGSFSCFSQVAGDSVSVAADTNRHSPKKAAIFSAVIPGAGQVYNHLAMPKGKKKAFWKVPLIYAGLGATGYYFISNQTQMRDLRREYNYREANNGAALGYQEYDTDGLLSLYIAKRTTRDLAVIGLAVVYLLNVADAAVEAHFVHFDISDDLSMNIAPTLLSMNSPGISLRLNFHSSDHR